MKRRLLMIFMVLVLTMSLSITAYAATNEAYQKINETLPSKQADRPLERVKRADGSIEYFTVEIESIGDGYTAVCAWTENTLGANLSSPSIQVEVESKDIDYYDPPITGTYVVLNLDNPVYTTDTPLVKGRWTPN